MNISRDWRRRRARVLHALALGALLASACVRADEKPASAPALDPVHVSAIRDPEVRKYKAILAGLDAVDRHRAMAPAVDRLRFLVEARRTDADSRAPLLPAVRLVGDGFALLLALDAGGRFVVPRSRAAEDADSELELDQKRSLYRIAPDVRTPGLPANQRRLGDLRLECKVRVAIMKAEMPFYWAVLLNGVLLGSDWCGFFEAKRNAGFSYKADHPISAALLREGGRALPLKVRHGWYEVPIATPAWSDEAMVELTFADAATGPVPVPVPVTVTGTAGETPRTAP